MLPQINWRPTKKQMRDFAWVILIGFIVLGILIALLKYRKTQEKDAFPALLFGSIGLVVWLSAIFLERTLGLALYYLWMGLAFSIGAVVTPIMISVLYFLLVTPLGLVLKLLGKDFLEHKHMGKATFWRPLNQKTDRHSYERQF